MTEAECIMVQGTASHVGKSVLAAALCRIFARDGYRVAPFKGWNMALNSCVTSDGGEIGRAQGEQAVAAGIEATVDMNPLLVKPKGPGQAQLIVRGQPWGDIDFRTRDEEGYVRFCLEVIAGSLATLRREYEIVVIEGAGSPAEINLAAQDVANMKVAHLAEAPVILVSDIDRGGALAAVVGTMLLLPQESRELVAGFIFNKFRGDRSLLEPGLDVVRERTGKPVLGVVPYMFEQVMAEEDGVALESRSLSAVGELCSAFGQKVGKLRLRVVRLPHISNFTDLDSLAAEADVDLRFVAEREALADADAVIIPGTKNSIRDLQFIKEKGLAEAIVRLAAAGTPVVGICGGYQLLGQQLYDPAGQELGGQPSSAVGLGLLPVETRFYPAKTLTRLQARALLPFAVGEEVEGYEIHMGQTVRLGCQPAFLLSGEKNGQEDGAISADGQIFGTYLHGVFDRPGFRRAWLNMLRRKKGWSDLPVTLMYSAGNRFDVLADHVHANLDVQFLYGLLGLPGPRRAADG